MLALRTRFSFLSHPVEHRGGNAIRNLVAHEELLEIVQCHSRDFLPHMAPAAGNVGRDNRTWNGSQRIVHSERLHGIGYIEGAAQTSRAHFFPQGVEVDQASTSDVNDGRSVRKRGEVFLCENSARLIS